MHCLLVLLPSLNPALFPESRPEPIGDFLRRILGSAFEGAAAACLAVGFHAGGDDESRRVAGGNEARNPHGPPRGRFPPAPPRRNRVFASPVASSGRLRLPSAVPRPRSRSRSPRAWRRCPHAPK